MKDESAILISLAVALSVVGGLYAFGYLDLGGDTEKAINPVTGKPAMCPNIPTLEKKRELYNVYVIGKVDEDRIYPPDRILITKEDLDKNSLSIVSLDAQVVGYLYTTIDQPQRDIGYEGRIYFYQSKEYRMKFSNVPSNWNCENYPSAWDSYRPNGARYNLQIVLKDMSDGSTVDTYEQIVYVKYRGD